MAMRRAPRNSGAILDRLHRGAVWTCIGLTLYGSYLTGMRVYNYFTVIRPMKKQQELEFLKEGAVPEPVSLDSAKELKL